MNTSSLSLQNLLEALTSAENKAPPPPPPGVSRVSALANIVEKPATGQQTSAQQPAAPPPPPSAHSKPALVPSRRGSVVFLSRSPSVVQLAPSASAQTASPSTPSPQNAAAVAEVQRVLETHAQDTARQLERLSTLEEQQGAALERLEQIRGQMVDLALALSAALSGPRPLGASGPAVSSSLGNVAAASTSVANAEFSRFADESRLNHERLARVEGKLDEVLALVAAKPGMPSKTDPGSQSSAAMLLQGTSSAIQWSEFSKQMLHSIETLLETRFARHEAALRQLRGASAEDPAPAGTISTASRPAHVPPAVPAALRISTRATPVVNGGMTRTNSAVSLGIQGAAAAENSGNTTASSAAAVLTGGTFGVGGDGSPSPVSGAEELRHVTLRKVGLPASAGGSAGASASPQPAALPPKFGGMSVSQDLRGAQNTPLGAPAIAAKPLGSKRNSLSGLSSLFGRGSQAAIAAPGSVAGSQMSLVPASGPQARTFNGLPANLDAAVLDPMRRVHQSAVYELFQTEGAYVSDLELVAEFQECAAAPDSGLDAADVDAVFLNVAALLAPNRALLHELDVRSQQEPGSGTGLAEVIEQVGDVFLALGSAFEVYTHYCAHQKHAVERLKHLEAESPAWRALATQFRDDARAGGLALETFLLKPVQRICKYPMMLKEILKYTPSTSPDGELLQRAIDQMRSLLGFINEETRSKEIAEKFRATIALIDGADFLKLAQRRGLLMGLLQISSSFTSKDRYVMLFEDMLVILKTNRNRYLVEGSYRLRDISVHEKSDSRRSFKVLIYNAATDKRESLSMQCTNEEEKRLWMNAIALAVSALAAAPASLGPGSVPGSMLSLAGEPASVKVAAAPALASVPDAPPAAQRLRSATTTAAPVIPGGARQRSGSVCATDTIGTPLGNTAATVGSIANISSTLNPRTSTLVASLHAESLDSSAALPVSSCEPIAPRTRQRASTVTSYVPLPGAEISNGDMLPDMLPGRPLAPADAAALAAAGAARSIKLKRAGFSSSRPELVSAFALSGVAAAAVAAASHAND